MASGARPDLRRGRGQTMPEPGHAGSVGVEANARLTSSTAVVLFLLLAVEGATVVSVRSLLGVHVFVGVLVIPPVLLKIGSTVYRFARYYGGAPAYREKGPPPWLLRLVGPAVVVLTVVLLGTGVGLMFAGSSGHRLLLAAHKASFIMWFAAMTVHVLGHLSDTVKVGLPDWVGGAGRVVGAGLRRTALVASVAGGAIAGVVLLSRVAPYLASFGHHLGG